MIKLKKNNRNSGFQQPPRRTASTNYYSTAYEFMQLNTSTLRSNQPYQRKVRSERVQQIVDNFNPLYLDEVIVSCRGGAYYVVDGQNRIAALRKMNGGAHCNVNCKVFYGLTYEQEAEMFYHLDNIRGKLKYNEKVQARKESGDPDIQNILRIMSGHGIDWKLSGGGAKGDNTISASRVVVDCYEKYGPHILDTGIGLLVKTWGGNKEALNASFIKGACLFANTYAREVDLRSFAQKLSKFTPSEIKSLARQETIVDRLDLRYARVFFSKYNYNRPAGKRLQYKFEQ